MSQRCAGTWFTFLSLPNVTVSGSVLFVGFTAIFPSTAQGDAPLPLGILVGPCFPSVSGFRVLSFFDGLVVFLSDFGLSV